MFYDSDRRNSSNSVNVLLVVVVEEIVEVAIA